MLFGIICCKREWGRGRWKAPIENGIGKSEPRKDGEFQIYAFKDLLNSPPLPVLEPQNLVAVSAKGRKHRRALQGTLGKTLPLQCRVAAGHKVAGIVAVAGGIGMQGARSWPVGRKQVPGVGNSDIEVHYVSPACAVMHMLLACLLLGRIENLA